MRNAGKASRESACNTGSMSILIPAAASPQIPRDQPPIYEYLSFFSPANIITSVKADDYFLLRYISTRFEKIKSQVANVCKNFVLFPMKIIFTVSDGRGVLRCARDE